MFVGKYMLHVHSSDDVIVSTCYMTVHSSVDVSIHYMHNLLLM